MSTQGRKAYKSYDEQLADAIVARLVKKDFLKRSASQKFVFPEVLEIVKTFIAKDLDNKLDTSTVRKYNKAELRKDLIKEIKKGKVEAAKALMDLDNMKSSVDEVIIIPMNFKDIEGLKADEVLEKHLKDVEAKENHAYKFLEDV